MHIALFGGAFDPPHLGHLQVIQQILQHNLADQIWVIPVGQHDFLKQMSPSKWRVVMLELLLAELPEAVRPAVQINLCEIERLGISHSLDTLNQLQRQHQEHQFSWIIGSDNLAKFHLWDRYQTLLASYPVLVYPRTSFPFKPLYPNMRPLSELETIDISSTEIRATLSKCIDWSECQQLLTNWLPASIINFIQSHKLYCSSKKEEVWQ